MPATPLTPEGETILNDIIVRQIPAGPYEVFTYLVACPVKKEGVIIDPAGEEEKIAAIVDKEKVAVKYILNTHGHADHILANRAMKTLMDAPTAMHRDDAAFFAREEVQKATSKEFGLPPQPPPDMKLTHGDIIKIGDLEMRVIHTPGHTPGSVCYLVAGNLFTGDTLFYNSVGRTDFSYGSSEELLRSIKNKIVPLPKDSLIFPGHGPATDLQREVNHNPFLAECKYI